MSKTKNELAKIESIEIAVSIPVIETVDLQTDEISKIYDEVSALINKLSTFKTQLEEAVTKEISNKLVDGAISIQMGGFEFKVQKRAYKVPAKPLEELHDEVFVKSETKLVVDTSAINDYVKKNGKLPDGFVEEVRTYPKLDRVL